MQTLIRQVDFKICCIYLNIQTTLSELVETPRYLVVRGIPRCILLVEILRHFVLVGIPRHLVLVGILRHLVLIIRPP